jgi:hypothetical protein
MGEIFSAHLSFAPFLGWSVARPREIFIALEAKSCKLHQNMWENGEWMLVAAPARAQKKRSDATGLAPKRQSTSLRFISIRLAASAMFNADSDAGWQR